MTEKPSPKTYLAATLVLMSHGMRTMAAYRIISSARVIHSTCGPKWIFESESEQAQYQITVPADQNELERLLGKLIERV